MGRGEKYGPPSQHDSSNRTTARVAAKVTGKEPSNIQKASIERADAADKKNAKAFKVVNRARAILKSRGETDAR
jgi:hypothetical protein